MYCIAHIIHLKYVNCNLVMQNELVRAVSKIIVMNKPCEIIYKILKIINLSSPSALPRVDTNRSLWNHRLTDLVRTPLSY